MALPATLVVKINLSGGASFGNPFILGTSQLGFAELASLFLLLSMFQVRLLTSQLAEGATFYRIITSPDRRPSVLLIQMVTSTHRTLLAPTTGYYSHLERYRHLLSMAALLMAYLAVISPNIAIPIQQVKKQDM